MTEHPIGRKAPPGRDNMKKYLLPLTLILIFSVSFVIGYADSVTLDNPTEDGIIWFISSAGRWNNYNYLSMGYEIGSFLPETRILMADGVYKRIADIQIGERVISLDPYTNEEYISEVLEHITHETLEYLIINGMLKISPEHNIWSNGEFKRAGELKIGDCLLDSFNREIPIKTIEKIEIETVVHDLNVTFPHTFYAEGFLVHNIYYTYRSYIEWDISSIPDGATITDIIFKYHGYTNNIDCHIHECVGQRPSTAGDGALYDEIGEGTVYADPAGFPEVGTNKQVDLGASADSDLQNQLTADWFAIGIQSDNEGTKAVSNIRSEEYASTPDPTLYVEYTVPPPVAEVNVIFFSTPY